MNGNCCLGIVTCRPAHVIEWRTRSVAKPQLSRVVLTPAAKLCRTEPSASMKSTGCNLKRPNWLRLRIQPQAHYLRVIAIECVREAELTFVVQPHATHG